MAFLRLRRHELSFVKRQSGSDQQGGRNFRAIHSATDCDGIAYSRSRAGGNRGVPATADGAFAASGFSND
jgi:hypothetical protein